MQNLRIVSVQVIDSTNISVTFTESLTPNLVTSNVSIIAETPNVPTPQVLQIKITQSTIDIVCQPLTPMAAYYVQFQSLPLHPFESVNGDAILLENGVANKYLITAPLASDNPVQNYLQAFYNDNIYNLEDPDTIISKYVQSLAINLSRALYDIRQVKNENYLSFTITDERKIRGPGPFDRLNEEAAYQILRLGRGPSTTSASSVFPFSDFPAYPVTLQKESALETLSVNSIDATGVFNINSLTLNLTNYPVTKLISVVFTFNNATQYTYNISTLGYQILDSRYDQDFGFTYLLLTNKQIRLSDKVLSDPTFLLDQIVRVDVQYEYKNLGVVVDPTTVSVTTVLQSIREVLPPIINVFNLQHAPIVDANGNTATFAGVTFTDPNSNTGAPHPAFVVELPFRLSALPFAPGQYSIDYSTGQVYVYGSDLNNDGTGPFPPLATYNYLFTYKSEIDYVYDPDLLDLVSLPLGNLRNNAGSINFKYEQVFVPGVDYNSALHQEALTERIGNRLLAINVIQAQNSPITNVFKIYNETSGEIYTLDRWSDNKIYFRYNNPPRVLAEIDERTSFNTITNELLFVNTTLTNSGALRVFKIFLNNNTLAAATEDTLASSFNTSLVLSAGNVFVKERWFNKQFTESANINRLASVGDYTVDYANGVIYVAVSNTQGNDIGTATYKNNSIVPQFPHVVSVDDIFYRLSPQNAKSKAFAFTSFGDGFIVPEVLEPSDELYLNNNVAAPYQISNGNVGIFYSSGFVSGVTYQVKFVRSLFEYSDLLNSTNPINFASAATGSGFNINVSTISREVFENIQFDGVNNFVTLNENIPYISPNITYTYTITRVSDSAVLGIASVVPGNPLKLVLSGVNSPAAGQNVRIDYSFKINNLSRIAVDYNKGDLFIDYTYVADEVIISYEYGDNVIDFRGSSTVPENTQYFVSYKVGALRDALLKNFGTLVNVPLLSNFDVDLDRERYRDALTAALTSFIQGPTVTAIKNIGKTISHIEPQVIESIFQNWSLGTSLLYPESVSTTGAFQLLPAKFADGAMVSASSQTITFPLNSNLRLEDGTFETWIVPQWNGLDNDASLTFTITKDGYTIPTGRVFVGSAEYHPTIANGQFTVNKGNITIGTPNTNKDGVFIYYDFDPSLLFYRWYVRVIDGYVTPNSSAYTFKIASTGTFYNVKQMNLPALTPVSTTTGLSNLSLNIAADGYANAGITFISDIDHYLLDFGQDKTLNRMSIFKDISGYLNFRIYDKFKRQYIISYDASSWLSGVPHHVAASWKLNTANGRDEMHLFVDGLEVPNIIKYGQALGPYLHEKFRTVNPEEIAGLVNRDIIAGTDLHTTAGSQVVSSSINFSAHNIFAGDTIFIDEIGFASTGYTINTVSGQLLTLNTPMPLTLTNARFSVNRTQFNVTSEIDIYPNIAVTTIHTFLTGSDLSGTGGTNQVTSTGTNFSTHGVVPGYLIRIDGYGSQIAYSILQVSGNTLTINGVLPASPSFSNATFQIYSNTENEIPGVRALRPSYSISEGSFFSPPTAVDGYFINTLTVSNNVLAGDLILVRTLGLNFRSVEAKYYVWSDGYENVLMTNLPPPVSLNEATITKVILPRVNVPPAGILPDGYFTADGYDGYQVVYQPSNTLVGRTLSVTISGNPLNVAFPVTVYIDGSTEAAHAFETITFTNFGTLDTINLFTHVNFVHVVATPLRPPRPALTIEIEERYPITYSEANEIVPVIRYSYPIGIGHSLYSVGANAVRDDNNQFSALDITNYLYIQSGPAAGFYPITSLSADRKTIFLGTSIVPFTGASYQILNVTAYRSGLQNGFFTLEVSGQPGQPWHLNHGFYEVEYATYASIKVDPSHQTVHLGSNFQGTNQLNGIIDQVKIYSTMLTDTRIGESIPSNQRSITKDYNSLKPLAADNNTLMLLSMDSFPFTNLASFYVTPPTDTQHFQSSVVVNENFGQSLVITDNPIIVPNDGVLDARKQGTIEFWVNPLIDTGNDPNDRFYFDAFGAVVEEAVSVNNASIKISSPIERVLSVRLAAGDPKIDYFAGGKVEIDTQRVTQEEGVSLTNATVLTALPILQVITVKIIGDFTGKDYFAGGSVGTDQKTIYLGTSLPSANVPLLITYQAAINKNDTLNTQVIRLNKKLPAQNSKVIVNYIPKGLQGDRISLWKDKFGYVNFGISASGSDFVIRAPTRWVRGTWHRIKASYKVNGGANNDEIRLFVDGYEWTNVLFGTGLIFGQFPTVTGVSMPGDGYNIVGNISFKDPINDLFIGSQYDKEKPIFSLIDNFRISDISRPLYAPYGESLDVNYSSNLGVVIPVTSDLFTTYLLDFNSMKVLNTDFSILNTRGNGSFDFSVNILDSLGIVNSSVKVKEILEELINVLKPANSQAFITYTR